jgi:hypothetical protein
MKNMTGKNETNLGEKGATTQVKDEGVIRRGGHLGEMNIMKLESVAERGIVKEIGNMAGTLLHPLDGGIGALQGLKDSEEAAGQLIAR